MLWNFSSSIALVKRCATVSTQTFAVSLSERRLCRCESAFTDCLQACRTRALGWLPRNPTLYPRFFSEFEDHSIIQSLVRFQCPGEWTPPSPKSRLEVITPATPPRLTRCRVVCMCHNAAIFTRSGGVDCNVTGEVGGSLWCHDVAYCSPALFVTSCRCQKVGDTGWYLQKWLRWNHLHQHGLEYGVKKVESMGIAHGQHMLRACTARGCEPREMWGAKM